LAHLVIGIAATADEHLNVLANLAEVLEDPEGADELAQTMDPAVIVERLTRSSEEE
jgi:phosphocarrier protein FPr